MSTSNVLYATIRPRRLSVPAEAWSADMKVRISFEATPYLRRIGKRELQELAEKRWRGEVMLLFAADEAGDAEAQRLVEYCRETGQSFSVLINADAADEWLDGRYR